MFSFILPDATEFAIVSANTFSFDPPAKFSSKEVASERDYRALASREPLPDVITAAVKEYLPESLPISPMLVFVYVKQGLLPPFVVNYFISIQPGKTTSVSTKFFKALHLIEAYRASVYRPAPLPLPQGMAVPALPPAALIMFQDTVLGYLKHMLESDTFDGVQMQAVEVFVQAAKNLPSSSESDGSVIANIMAMKDEIMTREAGKISPTKDQAPQLP